MTHVSDPWPDAESEPQFFFERDCFCAVCCEQRAAAHGYQMEGFARLGRHIVDARDNHDAERLAYLREGAAVALTRWEPVIEVEVH